MSPAFGFLHPFDLPLQRRLLQSFYLLYFLQQRGILHVNEGVLHIFF